VNPCLNPVAVTLPYGKQLDPVAELLGEIDINSRD
jgi:hypothetical protein